MRPGPTDAPLDAYLATGLKEPIVVGMDAAEARLEQRLLLGATLGLLAALGAIALGFTLGLLSDDAAATGGLIVAVFAFMAGYGLFLARKDAATRVTVSAEGVRFEGLPIFPWSELRSIGFHPRDRGARREAAFATFHVRLQPGSRRAGGWRAWLATRLQGADRFAAGGAERWGADAMRAHGIAAATIAAIGSGLATEDAEGGGLVALRGFTDEALCDELAAVVNVELARRLEA